MMTNGPDRSAHHGGGPPDEDTPGGDATSAESAYRPIWDRIREIMADVPEEELRNLPHSHEVDRVVYGQPDHLNPGDR